jgi:amino acid transporter
MTEPEAGATRAAVTAGRDPLPQASNDVAVQAVRLSGRMGTGALALTVLAFSAPLSVVSGFIPFTLIFGGEGATFAFVAATIVLTLFAVGYVTMTKHVPKPGDFYAFISAGLGKTIGLGAAFLAVAAYLTVLAGCYAWEGNVTNGFLASVGGPGAPWWVWGLATWVVVSILGYFHIEVSAKILMIAMVLEVAVVVIFDIAVLARGGAEGLSSAPFNPTVFARGDIGVTMLFAIMVFLGFEATALFRDEVCEPGRTIPRATYGAVLFVGVLYTVSCYALTTAYGSAAVSKANDAPAEMFPTAIGHFVAPVFTQLTFAFVMTSNFAACLSIHNVLARYVHNLGHDRALPHFTSRIHARHGSPHFASAAVGVIVGLLLLPFIIGGADGATLYGRLVGLGSVGVLCLMALVSAAIIAWFAGTGIPRGESLFKTFLAPALAGVALAYTVVLAVLHFELVAGGAPGENTGLLTILAMCFILGAGFALYLRYTRPQVFSGLGRADRATVVEPSAPTEPSPSGAKAEAV